MVTCTKNSQIQIKTQFILSDANFILFKHATSITPATTYSGNVTPSTLIHTQILCYALLLMRKMLNPTGMRECSESIMPTFGPRIWWFLVPKMWVHWLGEEPGYHSWFYQACLPKIGFVESTDEFAFSFVDPANVVWECHLIPAFNAGRSADLLPWPHSIARHLNPEDIDDWLNYYVNMWVDNRLPQFNFWFDLSLTLFFVSFVDQDIVMDTGVLQGVFGCPTLIPAEFPSCNDGCRIPVKFPRAQLIFKYIYLITI